MKPKNFHLRIECPSWFKVGDWDKIESKLLKIGEFLDEPDACNTSIGEMSSDETVDEMISECFNGNYHLREEVKELVLKGNGDCPACGYPDIIVDGSYNICGNPTCRCTWIIPDYQYEFE